ncbi:hypothetical protein EDC18_105164 [Natranaerovirga pectinivora]|uniref:Uncharacterized protein n=1 Tax=Natranaerovirga pectinivora TaxID=682400 RepID=A0A4R3MN93_9FIRM|nr:hypothetical protein EDC18_105164 [Natranaerovirga pectinivora]
MEECDIREKIIFPIQSALNRMKGMVNEHE